MSNSQSMLPSSSTEWWRYEGPQDVPVHGGAGRVNRIRIDPNDEDHWLACAPSGGLWQTWDAGAHWDVLGIDALAPLGVTDVWMDPANSDHFWVATGDGNGGDTYSIGLLETLDGGQTWWPLELSFEAAQGRRIQAITPHPVDGSRFLIASDLGVFSTLNGGVTFSLVHAGNARDVVWMNDSTALAAIENQGMVRTVDGGETWASVFLPETNNSVGRIQVAAAAYSEGYSRDTVYAVAGHYFQQNFLALWQSTDAGLTWTAQSTRLTGPNLLGYTVSGADNGGQAFWDLCVEVDPNNAQRVLVGGVNLWESQDEGVTWTCPVHWQGAHEAHYAHADQHDIQFLSNGSVLLANDGGVFEWGEEGVRDLSSGLHITQGYALSSHPGRAATWMVGTQDNGTNLISPDFEARILDGDGFCSMFDSQTPNRLYASAYYGLLYRSDDGGRTLTNIANYFQSSGPNELGSWQTPFQLHPAVPGRIVAAKKSLHWSDDGGGTWTTVGGMGTSRSTALALSSSDPNVALVAKNASLHFWSGANGEFNSVPAPSSATIGDLAIASDSAGTWWVAGASYALSEQMWRSSDQGNTWQNISLGLPALPVHRVIQLSDGSWVCGSELGVHRWNESLETWETWGQGLPLTPVVDLVEDALMNRLMASTYGRGVWCMPLPDAPETGACVVDLLAPENQCMFSLNGTPRMQGTGLEGLADLTYVVTATQGPWQVTDSVECLLAQPLEFGESTWLPSFELEVPAQGAWEVEIQLHANGSTSLGPAYTTTLRTSGLGHTMTLEWWGDCESVDARWELRDLEVDEILQLSSPVAPGDTLSLTWCLAEGCYEVLWQDSGNDGYSGQDCGEAGGYRLKGPFGDVLFEDTGTDFGGEVATPFCVEVPWCYADYNGDGQRSVNDLLTLLSDFGCSSSCFADNSLDGSVGVTDLMNVLSVYGTGCDPDE